MLLLELKGSKQIYCQDGTHLTLQYYLIQTNHEKKPVYGIQIQSFQDSHFHLIHSESIQKISYSRSYVTHLIQLCMKNSVTPTDLFSSLDILMDALME